MIDAEMQEEKLSCEWLAHHKTGWQFGEQGVLEAIIDRIEPDIPQEHRWAIEFGAGDGATLPLTIEGVIRREGWKSLLIEADETKHDVLRLRVPPSATLVCAYADTNPGTTIDDHMQRAGCPETPALMVIDVDGIDYYIAATMKARPYVLCVEHLDTEGPFRPTKPFVPRMEDAGSPVGVGFGLQANYLALDATLIPSGYTAVFRTRVNSVYVRNDMVMKVAEKQDTTSLRINVGAGPHNDPRYVALDIKTGTDARSLPYADNSVDEVYCSHLLEHFTPIERDKVLREFVRVLKPNGLCQIAVPDAKKVAEAMLKTDESGEFRTVEMVMYGAHSDPNDIHHAAYTENVLAACMNAAGLGGIEKFHPFIRDDCSNHPMSLNLKGRKRWWPRVEKPVVSLILSQPRLAFTGHELRLIELAKKMDFDVQPSVGAFWDRDITIATQIADQKYSPDFLLYSDYDSVFEVEDVKTMLEEINNNPTMAAIGAVQMSRHNDEPLVLDKDVDYSGVISKVTYQHFGLLLLRPQALAEMPQPWFWSIPGRDAKGNWDWDKWNRSDADITFWRNMKLRGFNVYQHNGVCLGHICQCIKYPRNTGRGVQYVPIENYWKYGKPRDAMFNPALYPKVDKNG